LPAVEVPKNWRKPPPALSAAPPLVVKLPFCAVELSKKCMIPPKAPLTAPLYRFVMPTPLIVNVTVGVVVMVNPLAPALNTVRLTSVLAEVETPVVLETPNIAVSAAPLGTVAGVQLIAVFQSPLTGLARHFALPPKAVAAAKSKKSSVGAAASELTTLRHCPGGRLSEVLTGGIVR